MKLGVEFDRDEHNALQKTLEGGHSKAHRPPQDQTGKEIVDKPCLPWKTAEYHAYG